MLKIDIFFGVILNGDMRLGLGLGSGFEDLDLFFEENILVGEKLNFGQ